LSQAEDSYGRLKRWRFVEGALRDALSRSVLDFGCGTGTQLTRPLAEALPAVEFLGVDVDQPTIEWAREHSARPNLRFATLDGLASDRHFDAIIASEVLEHIDRPDALLRDLHGRMTPNGTLIVTVPNGYGPFEMMAFLETLLTLSGFLPLLRRLKHGLTGRPLALAAEPMTLASSPHINFLSYADVGILLREAGFFPQRFRSRTVFCGFIFDWLIRGRLARWNAALGDWLPKWCASDWMFVCQRMATPSTGRSTWRRGRWSNLRRRLSERRWPQAATGPLPPTP
jgi:SAM-dependent methyltransferase